MSNIQKKKGIPWMKLRNPHILVHDIGFRNPYMKKKVQLFKLSPLKIRKYHLESCTIIFEN